MDQNSFSEYCWVIIIMAVLTAFLVFAPELRDTLIDYSYQLIAGHFA